MTPHETKTPVTFQHQKLVQFINDVDRPTKSHIESGLMLLLACVKDTDDSALSLFYPTHVQDEPDITLSQDRA
jgi:hypothetical protein